MNAIDADYTESTALAVRDDAPSPALFGTDDPVEIITKAVRVADALKAVVASKGLISNIQGKEYPQVEAWLTLAAMLRLTSIMEWSKRTDNGWEARVVVRDRSGMEVGAGEAQCTRDERTWAKRDDYALRSMAQTRATSKALRNVLAFVMVLAGFAPTPAEEMPAEMLEKEKAAPPKPSRSRADDEAALTRVTEKARQAGVIAENEGAPEMKAWAQKTRRLDLSNGKLNPIALSRIEADLDADLANAAAMAAEAYDEPPVAEDVAGAGFEGPAPAATSDNDARLRGDIHRLTRELGISDVRYRTTLRARYPMIFDGVEPGQESSTMLHGAELEAIAAYYAEKLRGKKL